MKICVTSNLYIWKGGKTLKTQNCLNNWYGRLNGNFRFLSFIQKDVPNFIVSQQICVTLRYRYFRIMRRGRGLPGKDCRKRIRILSASWISFPSHAFVLQQDVGGVTTLHDNQGFRGKKIFGYCSSRRSSFHLLPCSPITCPSCFCCHIFLVIKSEMSTAVRQSNLDFSWPLEYWIITSHWKKSVRMIDELQSSARDFLRFNYYVTEPMVCIRRWQIWQEIPFKEMLL